MTAFAAGAWLPSCASPPPQPTVRVVTPRVPLLLDPIEDLAPAAGLEWILIASPQLILSSRALQPELGKLFPEFRFEAFNRSSAIDVRKLKRVAVASYGGSTLFVLGGVADPMEAERRLRQRLMLDVVRAEHREDVVMVSGKLASGEVRAFAALQPDVVVIESGGGKFAKAACLRAVGKLKKSPPALQAAGLPNLVRRMGDAPLRIFAPGPFQGQWENGLHGLLGSASAAAGAVRVTPIGTLQASLAVAGEWGDRAEEASLRLEASWKDLAASGFGRLTGLCNPAQSPLPTHAPEAASLTVEVGAHRFLEGLRAAVSARIEEIMR